MIYMGDMTFDTWILIVHQIDISVISSILLLIEIMWLKKQENRFQIFIGNQTQIYVQSLIVIAKRTMLIIVVHAKLYTIIYTLVEIMF